jgi:hypothetical protein
MKVGKAKGLNTIWLLHMATTPRRPLKRRIQPGAADALLPRAERKTPFIRGQRACASNESRAWVVATAARQIVFRPFSLVTFFWASRRR